MATRNVKEKMDEVYMALIDLCEEMLQYPPHDISELDSIKKRYDDGYYCTAISDMWRMAQPLLRQHGWHGK